ncbi:MAG: cysteine synthase A [Clostridia bacterium]|nr:cysteine synthase A [Clostridia bacterium]
MGTVYTSLDQLIGHTPMLELRRIGQSLRLHARVLAKLEGMNPAGSTKDRAALSMLNAAAQQGRITQGSVIIEPTSGNTGIGICAVAAARGYRAMIVMPDNMSVERQLLMRAYGAELVLTPGEQGMAGAIEKAKELEKTIPGAFLCGQFENPDNAAAHYRTTGPEIFKDTDGDVDLFVAGVGTGGTITGVGEYLKEKKPDVRIIGVEPAGSAVLSGGKPGAHGLQGIGAGFIPGVLNVAVMDEIMPVTEDQAYAAARLLAREEGILCGISSGAALHAAFEQARREENAGKTIVVLLPDSGERYLSTDLYK